MASEKVTLYLYDLTRGLAKIFSKQLAGKQFDGIWHTSIVVYGTEYYYASGVQSDVPGTTQHGQPVQTFDMGETFIPKEMFLEFLNEISPRYSATTYDLFENNCNSFSQEVCQFLTGNNIPEFITNLPREALNTPFGPLVKQFSQAIANQINNPGSNGNTSVQSSNQNLTQATTDGNINNNLLNVLGSIGRSTTNNQTNPIPVPAINDTDNKSLVKTVTTLDQMKEIITDHSYVIFDFTMANCPPCRAIAPVFEKMLSDKTSKDEYQKASPIPKLAVCKIDIHHCDPLIPRYYDVHATPTFVYIKNGKEVARILGANKVEIEKKMDEMINEAQNSKPCIKLNMQNKFIPLEYNIFEEIKNFATIVSNLKDSLLSKNKINQEEWDSLMTIKYHLNDSPDSTNIITGSCINIIQKSIDLLNGLDAIPLLEIIKKLFLNIKVKEKFVSEKNTIILKLINKFKDCQENENRILLLMILCNWCSDLNSVKYLLSDVQYEGEEAHTILINYLSDSLLSENNEIVSYALKLLNNISLYKQYVNIDDEERDINIISAIVQVLQNESITKTSVKSLLTSLYLFIFENKQSSINDLLEVFDIETIINNIIKSVDEEIQSIDDKEIKKNKELLKDLGNRIKTMINNNKN